MSFPTLFYGQDPTGAWFTFYINTGGAGFTIDSASAPVPPPVPPIVETVTTTITLKDTIEWTKRFMANRGSVIGNSAEPAMTNANLILQTILGPPFKWRWNRVETGFITTQGQQDYYLFNWEPDTAVGLGWYTVDGYGNSQKVTTAGITGASTPGWNNTPTGTTSDGTGGTAVTWTNLGNLSQATSINYAFGWVEGSVVKDTKGNYQEMSPKIWLSQSTPQDRPREISGQLDDGSGNIVFRLQPVPDQAYPVVITLQQKPGLFTKVSQTWSPIPDEYSRIYDFGLLSLQLLYADDPRFQWANQKFVTALLGASTGLTDTERNIWLNNWQQVTGQMISMATTQQQGGQARAV